MHCELTARQRPRRELSVERPYAVVIAMPARDGAFRGPAAIHAQQNPPTV
jgi:hypothetical protein